MKIKNNIKIKGKVICILEDIKTNKIEITQYDNLITDAGLVALARRLGSIDLKTNEGMVTYGATGTDATAVDVTDTVLGTELARKTIAYANYSAVAKTVTIRTFYTTAESNGALKEFGLFGEDATAVADSGTLFEHANINITKTSAKKLTVDVVITFS